MLTDEQRKTIEQATVTIFTKEHGTGKGFVVPGGLIITAAHCVDYDLNLMPGDDLQMTFEGYNGTRFSGVLEFYEPVSDVAVFAAIDAQRNPKLARQFEQFVESITPLVVVDLPAESKFPVYVFSHERKWITGEGFVYFGNTPSVMFTRTESPVPCGTSGSPILNSRGEAISLVSVFADSEEDADGSNPLILRCLSRRLAEIVDPFYPVLRLPFGV